MLRIIIEGDETFNEETQEFAQTDDVVLDLEHSLLSLSKWESIYERPFLSSGKMTLEEVRGYLKAMVINHDADLDALDRASKADIDRIQSYIDSSQSATTFGQMPERRGPAEVITSELIYFWMVSFNIPFECETWHLNRLFALIRICNLKNSNAKPKKLSRHELAQQRADLNRKRREEWNTKG